jgi:small subunit ribosomal protein S21
MRKNKELKLDGRTVYVRDGENILLSLKKFKRKVSDSGILDDIREKEFYDKPSTKRKKAAAYARARWKKKLSQDQLPKKFF